jgi:mannose-1-phosphate guanylyltransferase
MDHFYAVITAGSGGTRPWPLSRQSRPGQMLAVTPPAGLSRTASISIPGTPVVTDTAPGRMIATIGLDNIVIVDIPDVLLVCHRDRTEKCAKSPTS